VARPRPGKSLAYAPWPIFDPDLMRDGQREYVVQLNGPIRHKIVADADMAADTLLALTLPSRATQAASQARRKSLNYRTLSL